MAPSVESVVREGHFSGIYNWSFDKLKQWILHFKNLSRIFTTRCLIIKLSS